MTFERVCAVAIACSAVVSMALAADRTLPLKVPVKILAVPASAAPPMTSRVAQPPVPAATIPSGKFPQYQFGHRQRRIPSNDELLSPRVRFFLALPNAVLLVDATLMIDGLPFPAVREQRIERLLKDVSADPASTAAEPAVVDRLRQSLKLTGQAPAADEVRWTLTNWIDGPTLLQLNDNFQRFRAYQRPGYTVLDRDRDGTVSAAEMQLAVKSFRECDLNRDDIIQFTEIASAAADLRDSTAIVSAHLITLLPDASTAPVVFNQLAATTSPNAVSRFDRNENGKFDTEELDLLRQAEPDLALTIEFDTKQRDKSRIILTAIAADLADALQQVTVDHLGITLPIADVPINFQAVQADASDQVSIGAVDDGYPLLPELDPNDDGRLTVRELRDLPRRLDEFDKNHDGALTLSETRAPIRVVFGLGPIVHRELAGIRPVHHGPTAPAVAGPEWFVRMDRNKDNDLTREEFPGTDEQFAALDADHDQLVGADEALAFDKKAGQGQADPRDQPSEPPARKPADATGTDPREQAKP